MFVFLLPFQRLTLTHVIISKPTPKVIQTIMHSLWNDDFKTAVRTVKRAQTELGVALSDLVTAASESLEGMKLPAKVLCGLHAELGDLEWRLSGAVNESLQASAFCGVFASARATLATDLSAARELVDVS